MNRKIAIFSVMLVALAIFFLATHTFEVTEPLLDRDLSVSLPSLSPPPLEILPNNDILLATQAWTIFQNYLAFAKAHNLVGIRSLSHQISATCNDSAKEKECFALMDSVYTIGSLFKMSDFKNVYYDKKQIVMNTDGPNVAILYFTRTEDGTPKVLGMRFCLEDESTKGTCAKPDSLKQDSDKDGWWDNVESLFNNNLGS